MASDAPPPSISIHTECPREVVSLTKLTSDGKIQLDAQTLSDVLSQENIANLPVIIFTIAGPFRTGKSFLFNLLTRHLKLRQMASADRIDEPNEELESVFPWKGGVDHHTEGILITKQPFEVDINVENHTKAVVFLMDIQGILGHHSSSQNASIIGAISFLMSSLICFNVQSHIDSSNIDYINRFAEFAKKIKNEDKDCQPFQLQSLMFLVRDWNIEDYDHGLEGGKAYLERVMRQPTHIAPEQCENVMMREHLVEMLGEIECFLIPSPGKSIKKRGAARESCKMEEIKPEFLTKATELFEHLLSPEQLLVKKINGNYLTCMELENYINLQSSFINYGLESDVGSFIQNVQIADALALHSDCMNSLVDILKDKVEELRTFNGVDTVRSSAINETMEKFDRECRSRIQAFITKRREACNDGCVELFDAFMRCLQAEKVYGTTLTDFYQAMPKRLITSRNLELKAKGKLEELLPLLKSKVDGAIADQCCKHFESHVDKFVRASENEREKLIKGIKYGGVVTIVVVPALFSVSFVPGVSPLAAVGLKIAAGSTSLIPGLTALLKLQNRSHPESEFTLNLVSKGKLHVTLFFGDVCYPME